MTSDLEAISRGTGEVSMNKELFGVFGGPEEFRRFRRPDGFDVVVEGESATAGLRTPDIGTPGRSSVYDGEEGACVVFGEVFTPAEAGAGAAEWTLDRYAEEGLNALGALNGSYVCVLEADGEAVVATDPIRSWEIYYADVDGARVFGTDVSALKPLCEDRAVDRTSLLELLHLGTVLGEDTLFESISRVPFDGYLTAGDAGSLDRFVYAPREADHVDALSSRLRRAIRRRSRYPGTKGLLLSAGKDSRVFLSQLPDVAAAYTIGSPDAREVRVARKVAAQYDTPHTTLEPSSRYILPTDRKVLYSQGIKEALHIHHAGYRDEVGEDVMYHGLLFDTLLKGYFLERDGVSVFGSKLESNALVSDPDPVESLLDTLGYLPDGSRRVASAAGSLFGDVDLTLDSPRAFLRERLASELETCWERADSPHNATDLLVVKNQPVMPFRTHLADNYLDAFVAVDAELLDWHLRTPPEHRSNDTYNRALRRVDDRLLAHRPPSQPHRCSRLNQIERFLRRKLPFVEAFEPAWPDRRAIYDGCRLDERLFPDSPSVHDLPPRQKLRLVDARWWLS
ncbi:MAG: hypothetical protein ABEJ28_07195 [Salinigranum sp.]